MTNDSTIKLRLTEEMRKYIESEAEKGQVSMSEYIRQMIERDMNRLKNKKEKKQIEGMFG